MLATRKRSCVTCWPAWRVGSGSLVHLFLRNNLVRAEGWGGKMSRWAELRRSCVRVCVSVV